MISVTETALQGVLEIRPERFADERGFFTETWHEDKWRNAGISFKFVQDNHSLSRLVGTLRGLHFQRPPAAQDKLVWVSRGSVFDVAVDVRRRSPTYGRWVGVTLSTEAGNQLLIPRGFAHGFVSLEPETEVQYKVTAPYSPDHEGCIRFDDPAVGVEWPIAADRLTLSHKDRSAPLLADIDTGL
jgi:dTDP-4-dehydrorhamnose 3,5-epimerase